MGESYLKCLQINLHHAKLACNMFTNKFINDTFDIALIQEPYHIRHRIRNINGCQLLYKRDGNRPPRAAIAFRRGLKYLPLTQFQTEDLVAATIEMEVGGLSKKVIFCSGYHDANLDSVPVGVKKLVEFCKESKIHLIYGIDANAHNELWGSKKSDKRGEDLLDFLLANDVTFANTGSKPTFGTKRRTQTGVEWVSSHIDLTIVSNFISDLVQDWRVEDEDTYSDHNYITFRIRTRVNEPVGYRDPSRTNWVTFKEKLGEAMENIESDIREIKDIDSLVEKVNTALLCAYYQSNERRFKISNKKNSWWNKNLAQLRKEVRKLWNKANSTGNYDIYKDALNHYTKAVEMAKEQSWKKLTEELDNVSSTSRLHKLMSKDHTNKVGTLKSGSKYTTNERETLLCLAETHFPGSRILDSDLVVEETQETPEDSDFSLSERVSRKKQYHGQWIVFPLIRLRVLIIFSRRYCNKVRTCWLRL